MNFAQWLFRRAVNSMSGAWDWVDEYRKLIIEVPFLAILLTFLIGAVWFIICGVVFVWANGNEPPPRYVLYFMMAVPPLFLIYNWLAAMYEIYDRERQATWDELKKPYN